MDLENREPSMTFSYDISLNYFHIPTPNVLFSLICFLRKFLTAKSPWDNPIYSRVENLNCEIPHRLERRTSVSDDVRLRRWMNCEIPHRLKKGTSASKNAESRGGWIVRSHISWRGEQNILYKGVKISSYQTHFKNLEGKSERESPKTTISTTHRLNSSRYKRTYLH